MFSQWNYKLFGAVCINVWLHFHTCLNTFFFYTCLAVVHHRMLDKMPWKEMIMINTSQSFKPCVLYCTGLFYPFLPCLTLLQNKQRSACFSNPLLTVFFSLFLSSLTVFPEDESPGLHGFLNVIVHSASGLKQSLSESFTFSLPAHNRK